MYDNGIEVKKDYKKAVELFDKACDGGIADGCNNLGHMYANGKGVKMDMTRAMGYARRACDAGSWVAAGILLQVSKPITTKQWRHNTIKKPAKWVKKTRRY